MKYDPTPSDRVELWPFTWQECLNTRLKLSDTGNLTTSLSTFRVRSLPSQKERQQLWSRFHGSYTLHHRRYPLPNLTLLCSSFLCSSFLYFIGTCSYVTWDHSRDSGVHLFIFPIHVVSLECSNTLVDTLSNNSCLGVPWGITIYLPSPGGVCESFSMTSMGLYVYTRGGEYYYVQ